MMDRFQPSGISQALEFIFFLMVLWVASGTPVIQEAPPGCHLTQLQYVFEYKYYREGDILIGALFTVYNGVKELYYAKTGINRFILCMYPLPLLYKNVLTFIFAIDEINKNPGILPNITLGYHAYDTCGFVKKSLQNVLQILTGGERDAPNYSCLQGDKVAGFIGDMMSATTLPIAQVLDIYGYPQISYGATDTLLSNKVIYPHFFRTVQDDHFHNMAIIRVLKHFDWNWIGIIASVGGSGDRELQELSKLLTSHGICIEFIVKISDSSKLNQERFAAVEKSSSQIVITCGTCSAYCMHTFLAYSSIFQNKTFFITPSFTVMHITVLPIFNGSLGISKASHSIDGLENFIRNVQPNNRPNDPLLEDIWLIFKHCYSPNKTKNDVFLLLYKHPLRNCTGKENFTYLTIYGSDTAPYLVYTAVYAMAYALHNMHLHWNLNHPDEFAYKKKLSNFVRRVNFIDHKGNEIFFNKKGEAPGRYNLVQWRSERQETTLQVIKQLVATLDMSLPEDHQLNISRSGFRWKNDEIPNARCTGYCPPGHRKAPGEGYHTCCYVCVPCSDGEISEDIDNESCQKCPDDEWPDERKIKCIPKTYDFLSYEENIFQLFTFMSIFFSCITCFVLGIFVYFRDTPIVKSNNRNLSFLLLVCIMLSFLCVFLFLGCPVDITCMLRQTTFGIIFSMAVSSLLAKTIMVCIAFKAIKPGSHWRKWLGVKVSNSVVLMCSSVQVLISAVWLAVCPPFQEFDMKTYLGVIIIQCNEGSVFAFYSLLGYMGILAFLSFALAFMVRTLPDSFNEAKYITFSMLVFCSVWIAMIPAYLSSKGKDMVSVEIFAILASSAGILSCIFFPKCYTLLRKPEMNTRACLLKKTST